MARGNEVACGVPALELAKVCDTATGVELSPMEWEALFWNHLDHARHCQNMMIRLNRNLSSKGEGFGNEWARKNVRLVSLPTGFRNLSHQNRVNQCETARLTLAWKARERVADALDEIGWDKATQNGSFTQSFDDQTLGKEQAQQFISQGADIIMPVAGPVGLGAAAAAKADGNTWIIGVDSDWYEANPDYSSIVLTSVMKEIGASVEQAIQDSVNGKFSATPYVGTLANGGVSIAPFHDFDDKVSAELKADLSKLTDDIKSGKLVIESQNAPK